MTSQKWRLKRLFFNYSLAFYTRNELFYNLKLRADPASSGRGGADFPEGPTEVPPRELRQGSGEQPPVGSGAEPLVGVTGRSLRKLC